jgi:hypothetical protein
MMKNEESTVPLPPHLSSAFSGVEHLRLLVGKDSIADALLRHFGSLKALSRASFKEPRQFLPKGKAEAVMAALSIANIADAEHALSTPLNSAEAIYRANLDMKGFHQEVVRVVLLDTQHRCITKLDIAKGTVNESLAHPREILRPAIIHSAYAFALVHNLCVATHRSCYVKCGFMCGLQWSNVGCSLVGGYRGTHGARSVRLRSHPKSFL